jgi:glutaredoxin
VVVKITTLYSTHCPKCEILKKKLTAKNVEFDEVNDIDIMIEKGYVSSPMLEVDGEIMDFTKANNWINNI